MKTLANMYAVVIIKSDSKEICTTYNPSHNLWQPAIFETEEDAGIFFDAISSVKGYEEFEYSIVQVGVVL